MRRVVSLWFPKLAIERWSKRHAPPAEPLVLLAERAGRLELSAVNDVAALAGLAPGMALADARSLCPDLATAPADPLADARLLDRLVAWCGRYTPWTAVEGGDGLWLDVSGCAHLFGGERALVRDLRARLRDRGYTALAALADTPGAAWALARYGTLDEDGQAAVAPGTQRTALADLPVAALRLDAATASGLERLGLARIRDLYPLPRAPLAARFGVRVGHRLDQALGREPEPISPRRPVPAYRERLGFAEPIGRPEDVAAGLERLLARLCRRLEREQRGCRRLELTVFRVDGTAQGASIGTARAARDAGRLARLFAERLGHLDPGHGIETMVLAAPVTESLRLEQAGGAGEGARDVDRAADPTVDLAPLLDRLGNRLGFDRLVGLRPEASHLPERAQRTVPAAVAPEPLPWARGRPRPLRLLSPPEPVAAITSPGASPGASPGDAGPPAAFRWRRAAYRVRTAEGPERIAPEWWRADRAAWQRGLRDYWRIEDEDGRRFWLFRAAQDAARDADGRDPESLPGWYLHGLFG